MYGGIGFLLTVLYILLNVLMLRWAGQEPTAQFRDEEEYFNATLQKLLVPRHHGSPGHARVRDFLEEELQRMGFVTSRKNFFQGNFTNVVGFLNEEATHFLVLTCHYDSQIPRKGQKRNVLVSATDGAVSCAILLNLATNLARLTQHWRPYEDTGLALVFFDGHESRATEPVDSPTLDGSRHFVNVESIPLKLIGVLFSLNYIGAPNQTFPSYYENTDHIHSQFAYIEQELRESGHLVDCHVLFQKIKAFENDLPDDHFPFKEKAVHVMHIAPQKYPQVRHTAADTAENLHWPTIRNMIKILRRFISDYVINQTRDIYEYDFYDIY